MRRRLRSGTELHVHYAFNDRYAANKRAIGFVQLTQEDLNNRHNEVNVLMLDSIISDNINNERGIRSNVTHSGIFW